MAEIVLDHVSKRFPDGTMAADDANLDIHDGEFVILVGPSGCGKSTCLNMTPGWRTSPTASCASAAGWSISSPSRTATSPWCSSPAALYPHMTVRENMGFGLKLAHADRADDDRKVRQAAGLLELTELLDCKLANLSGGQRCGQGRPATPRRS